MANTGNRRTLSLKLYNQTQEFYTGVTKLNLPGDPDYVPVELDTILCPVPVDLSCPVVKAAESGADKIVYEFSLPVPVLLNPGFASLQVVLKNTVPAVVATHTYSAITKNYFSAFFESLPPSTYTLDLVYRDGASTVIHTCSAVATVVMEPVITWEGTAPFCQVVGSCGTEDTYDEATHTCQRVDTVTATPPSGGGGTPANAAHISNAQWNNGGAQILNPGYASNGSGTVAATLTTPHFWVNGNFQWDTGGRNTTDSRMNAAGIWVAGETEDPVGEWIGFVRVVHTAVAKTVYVALCADNRFRFSLNGTMLVDCPGNINGLVNFHFMNIYPVSLVPGPNYIEMWARNDGSAAGFAMEIYDQSLSSLIASTSLADLNIIFSTRDMFGQPFDLGDTVGWSCPVGYSLDTSGAGDPVCVQVITSPAIENNTGFKAYAKRKRLVNGVPDGFEENNTEEGGLGTYIPPVADEVSCPL